MWMGGNVPLGYDIPAPGTRILQVNQAEAETVRHIFSRYLKLGSVHALQRELADQGIRSKQRITGTGKIYGGCPLNRGALFHLLANPIYLGRIRHKGVIHEGGHEAIVSEDLFDKVQQRLATQAPRKRAAVSHRFEPSPLMGKLFDVTGELMTPTFARGSKGSFYRYYVSSSLQRGRPPSRDGIVRRIAAPDLEKVVASIVERWNPSSTTPLDLPLAIHLRADGLLIDLPANMTRELSANLSREERIVDANAQSLRIHVPLALPLRGGRPVIVAGAPRTACPDPKLIAALRKAHGMIERKRGLPLITASPASAYDRKILRLAFLAPDLQRDIVAGHQPPSLHLEKLRGIEIPLSWKEQRKVLGWHVAD